MNSVAGYAVALVCLTGAVSNMTAQVLILHDGTPVRLRLMRTVTSAEAKVGDTVDFEVTEPVVSQGLVIVPKGSLALGKVTRTEPKRRFGRGGVLEISVDSVRLADGSSAPLRASSDKGTEGMGSGRLAATIAASPVLVWVKGKEVAFQKGLETTAYLNGDLRLDEAQLRRNPNLPQASPGAGVAAEGTAERTVNPGVLTNTDIIQMTKAGLSEAVIMEKIKGGNGEFRTSAQDLIQLKEAGVSDAVIALILQQSKR